MKLHSTPLVSFLVLCSVIATAQKSEKGFFVVRLGSDTIAVESYEMDSVNVRGNSVTRIPKTTSRHYSTNLDKKGLLHDIYVDDGPLGDPVRRQRGFVYADDSVRIETWQDSVKKMSSVKISGRPYPFFADLFGVWYFAILNALQSKGAKEFGIMMSNRVLKYQIHGTPPGRLELANPDFGPIYATIDKDGILEKFDMTATTDKFLVDRVQQIDKQAIAKSFAERDKSGSALGILSPRDTIRANLNGATIVIDYGRPAMRGRKIFGNVVPWNVVWRLGANTATQITTDKALTFVNTIVEPGAYSLFALPSEGKWMLIVNRQHGQWGTIYDQSKDLVRLPLTTENLRDPVERFIFAIDARGDQGVLRFKWEKTEASIPFSVR